MVLIDYLGGDAKDEVLCRPDEVLRGPGVSAAANVWAVGDRDVAVRRVLFADAVGGGDLLNIAELSFGCINT